MSKNDNNMSTAAQIVKSAAAVVCTVALCASVTTSAQKLSDAKVKVAEATPVYGTVQSGSNENAVKPSEDSPAVTPDETTPADESTETPTGTEETTGTATQSTPAAEKKTATNNGIPSTKAEIINYCNKALNDAKMAKVGYTKTFVRKGGDNLPKIISSVIAQNKVTNAAKGDAKIKDDFPAAGFDWSSKLRESDVTSAELKPNGQYYEITLKLGKETNPGKGEASSYGRVMSVMDESDAKGLVPGVNTVNFVYHDGYVYAKIDSKTGKLIKAEFSATADLSANVKVFGDLKANNVKSTETFSDIKW